MKQLLPTVASVLFWLPAFAQSAADDCARARDPARCEARQAALAICSDKRGGAKQFCLDANMPPVDCSMANNPPKCEAAQKAKAACKDKNGKEQKKCMRDEQTRKKPKAGKTPSPA